MVAAMSSQVQKYDLPGCEIIGRLRFNLMRHNESCGSRSAAPDRQVIPMDHLGAAAKAQNRQDISRGAALDFLGVGGVVGDEPAADLGAVRPADDHRVAARKA